MDRAVNQSDKIEAALMRRLEQIYSDALMEALKKHQAFLKLVKDVADGKKKPPARYAGDPEKIAKWKAGFLREQMRQMGLIESISKDLASVGPEAAEEIRNAMVDVYAENREFTTDMIEKAVHTSFSQYDKRQIRVLMQETESPFSKIAYKNLGKDTLIRKRLQNEMAMATLLGESQRDIIKRIRKVTGQTAYQAKRVAQTERTRIQSQARYEACQEAADKGVHVVNTWTARMVNTRDAHAERNGKKAEQGKPFPGSVMKYPGDPAGGAAEVINCHCVLVPDAVMPYGRKRSQKAAETLESTWKSGIIKVDKVVSGHASTPKKSDPNTVIDHLNKDGAVNVRSFYGTDGLKEKDLHTDDHGYPKQHPYGDHGEHAHDYEWDADGRLKNKTTREISKEEKERSGDIFHD